MFTAGFIAGIAFVVPVGIVCLVVGGLIVIAAQLIVHVNIGD